MPSRLRRADPAEVAAAMTRVAADAADESDLRLLTRHFLAVLEQTQPGKSVEVRVPPYAAIQCIAGARHTRGTPPAVVETDPLTWVRLAAGLTGWADAVGAGLVFASGERSDLTSLLPLPGWSAGASADPRRA